MQKMPERAKISRTLFFGLKIHLGTVCQLT